MMFKDLSESSTIGGIKCSFEVKKEDIRGLSELQSFAEDCS
jgi:hypothetical protein